MKIINILLFFILFVFGINASEIDSISNCSEFQDETEKMLSELCNIHAVSGFEGPVRKLLMKYWQKQKVIYEVDRMGNLIGFLPANNEGPIILIMAHMDEIGFMVKKIHKDGFISAIPLGGWGDQVLWGHKWNIQIGDKSIKAISGMDAPHIFWKDNLSTGISKSKFFLDTGLSKHEMEEIGMRPGLPITPDAKFTILNPKMRYAGKAFDDRAGLSIMIDLMKILAEKSDLKCKIVFVATVQEEVGMRGSKTVYESIKPDLVINLEAGIARDYPTFFTEEKEPALGNGPTVFIYDESMIPNNKLISAIEKIAYEKSLPFQWEAELSYGHDGASIQQKGTGVFCVNIGLPVRYIHCHYGIIDRNDYDNTVKLLDLILGNIDFQFINNLL